MCQKCGNMPPGHITVVKYKQRIIKEHNFQSNPENQHTLGKEAILLDDEVFTKTPNAPAS